jgi:hypothetical protein
MSIEAVLSMGTNLTNDIESTNRHCENHCFITALSRNSIALMRHMLLLNLRVTHRLHPRELSMFVMQIWQCIDILHLHLHCSDREQAQSPGKHMLFLAGLTITKPIQ